VPHDGISFTLTRIKAVQRAACWGVLAKWNLSHAKKEGFTMFTAGFGLTAARAFVSVAAVAAFTGSVHAQTCPDIALTGAPLEYDASELFDGLSFDVIAGGDVDLGACDAVPGVGYIIEGPDFELALSGMKDADSLTLSVTGDCDTVLLVNDATAEWFFNDDADAFDPAITIDGAPIGVYDIWVGTYGAETCSALLTLQTSGGTPGK
jgi:hypothetical protein